MSKARELLASAGRGLGRFIALVFVFSLALVMLAISVISGATAEHRTEELIAHALPDRWEHLLWIPIPVVVALVVVALPTIVMGSLRKHAMNQLKSSWSTAITRPGNTSSGKTNGVRVQSFGLYCNWILRSSSPLLPWED